MMDNNSRHTARGPQMATSSMFFTNTNGQFKRNNTFIPWNNNFDPHHFQNQQKVQQFQIPKSKHFPRGVVSQSMIDINSTSSNSRPDFGMLDSMARKITPSFQEYSSQNEHPQVPQDNTAGTVTSQRPALIKKFSSTLPGQQYNGLQQPEENLFTPKKRRQTVDLGLIPKKQQHSEPLSFIDAGIGSEETKIENQQEKQINNGETQKVKNFQFLRKRKEAHLNEQSTAASTLLGVQNTKNIVQNQPLQTPFKKHEFFTPNQSKYTPHLANAIQSPQNNAKTSLHIKGEAHSVSPYMTPRSHPNHPNFEFKKKKIFDSPIEPSSARLLTAKQITNKNKEPLTMKQKWAIKVQREIKLQDFQLLQKLGKGAFGDVYMAQQKALGFICVIKKMSKKRIREAKVEEHILRQIKIQFYLNHVNLTSLFGYFYDEEYLYLILEALPDGSLQNVKKKKKLPEKQAASIIKQVTDGLRYMHEEYIIHRDLKPQNIFVNEGIIKLGDFGCSIYNRDLRLRNTVVGCLQYSSPEQLSKEGYSQKIDSWSLGILTYELLFGKSPFESEIIKLTQNKELKPELSSLNFPTGIPIKDETRRFIENLLESDPNRRMNMDEVLRHPFLTQATEKTIMKLEQV